MIFYTNNHIVAMWKRRDWTIVEVKQKCERRLAAGNYGWELFRNYMPTAAYVAIGKMDREYYDTRNKDEDWLVLVYTLI